jgi:hypothetical protein
LIANYFRNKDQSFIVYSKNTLYAIAYIAFFFFLSYSPILASPEFQITFRYAITTMPILLFVAFWSIHTLFDALFKHHYLLNQISRMISSIILFAITTFGLIYANMMLADGIVGPHDQDFTNIQHQLNEKVIPLLKDNKQVVIHAIACDKEIPAYGVNLPIHLEYGMRICQYQQQVIGVIIHSLRKLGYASNFNAHNEVIYHENEIIVNKTPWGSLVVNNQSNAPTEWEKYATQAKTIVTIDTRHLPIYKRHNFYQQIYSRINKG